MNTCAFSSEAPKPTMTTPSEQPVLTERSKTSQVTKGTQPTTTIPDANTDPGDSGKVPRSNLVNWTKTPSFTRSFVSVVQKCSLQKTWLQSGLVLEQGFLFSLLVLSVEASRCFAAWKGKRKKQFCLVTDMVQPSKKHCLPLQNWKMQNMSCSLFHQISKPISLILAGNKETPEPRTPDRNQDQRDKTMNTTQHSIPFPSTHSPVMMWMAGLQSMTWSLWALMNICSQYQGLIPSQPKPAPCMTSLTSFPRLPEIYMFTWQLSMSHTLMWGLTLS